VHNFVEGATLLSGQFAVGGTTAGVVCVCILKWEVLADVYEIIRVQSLFVVSVVGACSANRRHLLLFFPVFELYCWLLVLLSKMKNEMPKTSRLV